MAQPMRIVVLDGYTLNPGDNPWDGVAKLGELKVYDRTPAEQIVERSKGANVLLTNKTPLSADTIAKLPDLKFIGVLATGFNVVDINAAKARGIPVSNVPEYGTDAVAQFTFALILELCHHVGLHDQSVKAGEWENNADWCYWKTPLIELAHRKIGIVGFGRIGRRVGDIAHAMGMEVLAFDQFQGKPPAYAPFRYTDQAELFAQSDVVSLHCPLTPENTGMINRKLLGTMKKSAFLINASRGPLVNEKDLAEALNTGVIAGAALDVVSTEPIKGDNPLLKAKNCILTPHIAWGAREARQRLTATTVANIEAFLKGSPINVVNR
jgi:glycerate dehydrogenase